MRLEKKVILFFYFFHISFSTYAQNDTNYYESYISKITGRFYFSQKYTAVKLQNHDSYPDLDYRPNTTLNMGVGATYEWFTLNLAYGFKFLNQDKGKGETKYLDLQTHFYGERSNIDLFGQFYKGFYLSPKGIATHDNSYYQRPDIRVNEIGLSWQRVLNNKRFSYRAAALQNEWQKKSAGSFLLGAEVFGGNVRSDSAFYPTALISDTLNITDIRFFEIGPNAGYAYTLVLFKHFYITGSLLLNFDYGATWYEDAHSTDGFSSDALIRVFAGYNSSRSAISFTYTNSAVSLLTDSKTQFNINTGNARINYVRRIVPGPKTVRFLHPIKALKAW